jgi:hypothetical protein
MFDQGRLDMLCTSMQETGRVMLPEATVAEIRQVTDALGISDADVKVRCSSLDGLICVVALS